MIAENRKSKCLVPLVNARELIPNEVHLFVQDIYLIQE